MHRWDKQPGEPDAWFARFETYRLAGENRTFVEVYRRCAKVRIGLKRSGIPELRQELADRKQLAMREGWSWIEREIASVPIACRAQGVG